MKNRTSYKTGKLASLSKEKKIHGVEKTIWVQDKPHTGSSIVTVSTKFYYTEEIFLLFSTQIKKSPKESPQKMAFNNLDQNY